MPVLTRCGIPSALVATPLAAVALFRAVIIGIDAAGSQVLDLRVLHKLIVVASVKMMST